MKKLILYRLGSSDEGTFGILTVDGLFWHTLELPDRQNRPNISRIPAGKYKVTSKYSHHFKRNLYHVADVSKRTYIMIHGANFAGDINKGWQTHLQGCITLGKNIGKAKNKFGNMQRCVLSSRQAVGELMRYLNNKEFKIDIKDIGC